jgi:hypothetical protein
MRTLTGVMLVAGLIGLLFAGGMAWAKTTWIDDIANSVSFYKINYPNSNWESYSHELRVLRHAIEREDKQAVKTEMNKWLQMLRHRDHGIHEVAADELFNFSLMVAPVQEYGIAVPESLLIRPSATDPR